VSQASPKGKVVVFGIIGWYPLAGVVYQCLHYLQGLRRLGYDAYYVEDSRRQVYDPTINDYTSDARRNVAALNQVLSRYGFQDRWAFRGLAADGESLGECYGMTEGQLSALYRECVASLNITGGNEVREEHLDITRRIYVESDPFSSQVRVLQGDRRIVDLLDAHHVHFSFGENLGNEDCNVPVGRYDWQPTRQPVDLELWNGPSLGGDAYTTITTWQNKSTWQNEDAGISYQGEKYYWTKDREFMKVLELPELRSVPFELAVGTSNEVRQLLTGHGWRLNDSLAVSGDIESYRRYIQDSRAEFTVARDQYVRPRTGWFSDRSATYLGAGRPVITQETGFSKFLPSGKGLFGFQTMDDILAAVDAIEGDYEGNCRAAREIAAEYFSAEKVVGSLLERAGL
jgi:hypothetical protein